MTTRMIIDCDPGMDDAVALMLAMAEPALQLELVTAVMGNRVVETTTENARRVLDFCGATDVPVVAGAARPISYPEARTNIVHGDDGLGGAAYPEPGEIAPGFAPDALIEALEANPGEITVVAIGPLTNLALAELRSPGILSQAKEVLLMGGAAFSQGNATPAAEFNIYADPIAARIVFESGVHIVMFGLDVTHQAMVTREDRRRIDEIGNEASKLVVTMLDFYFRDEFLLHDPCPIAYLAHPEFFEGVEVHAQVDTTPGPAFGATYVWHDVVEPAPGPINTTVMTRVDRDKLITLLVDRLAVLP